MTACDYLILGGGRAGLCAAEAIRKNDKTGSITMISDEAQLPYSRPMLTKLPLAFYEVEKTLVQPESWYREQNITVLLRSTVLSMDAEQKTVGTSAGTFSYGKCIYAMGAHNFIPPCPGKDHSGVYSIVPFFHVPNQSRTRCSWYSRASERILLINASSKQPSSGSYRSHGTGTATVLTSSSCAA